MKLIHSSIFLYLSGAQRYTDVPFSRHLLQLLCRDAQVLRDLISPTCPDFYKAHFCIHDLNLKVTT